MSEVKNEVQVAIAEIYGSWLSARGHNTLDYTLEIWSRGANENVRRAQNAGWKTSLPFTEWPVHWESVGNHIIQEMGVWIVDADTHEKIRRPTGTELLQYKQMYDRGELGPLGEAPGSTFQCDTSSVLLRV